MPPRPPAYATTLGRTANNCVPSSQWHSSPQRGHAPQRSFTPVPRRDASAHVDGSHTRHLIRGPRHYHGGSRGKMMPRRASRSGRESSPRKSCGANGSSVVGRKRRAISHTNGLGISDAAGHRPPRWLRPARAGRGPSPRRTPPAPRTRTAARPRTRRARGTRPPGRPRASRCGAARPLPGLRGLKPRRAAGR